MLSSNKHCSLFFLRFNVDERTVLYDCALNDLIFAISMLVFVVMTISKMNPMKETINIRLVIFNEKRQSGTSNIKPLMVIFYFIVIS